MTAKNTASFGIRVISLEDYTPDDGALAGIEFALPGGFASAISWQIEWADQPNNPEILLQASLNGVTYYTLDTSTNDAGEIRTVFTAAKFLRAYAVSGDTEVTVSFVTNKFGTITTPNPFDQSLNTTDNVEFNSIRAFLEYGTAPFPSNGAIRLGDAAVNGDNNGIWGYEDDSYGDEVAILRLTLNDNDYAQITLGDDSFGRIDFDLSDNQEIIPSSNFNLGTESNPFGDIRAENIHSLSLIIGTAASSGDIRVGSSFNLNWLDIATDRNILSLISGQINLGDPLVDTGINIYGNNGINLSTSLDLSTYFNISPLGVAFALPSVGGLSYPINEEMGIGNYATFWGASLEDSVSSHPYFLWYDGVGTNAGVWRVNDLGIVAYYNPSFTSYIPGAADFERVVTQWNTDVAEIGAEKGGTGTLRKLRFLGAGILTNATILPTSDPGVPGQLWNNGGIVTVS